MIRVVVVEDSPSVRDLIVHILESDSEIRVVAEAADGEEGIDAVARLRPDVVTMDVVMPGMNGLETTKRIMAVSPVPIVVVSSTLDETQLDTSFGALEAGAVAAIPKPVGPGSPLYAKEMRRLIRTVRLMSEIKVVRRSNGTVAGVSRPLAPLHDVCRAVGIGASTGGPPVLAEILGSLAVVPTYPILVVQHMAEGFIPGLASWINKRAPVCASVAEDGEHIAPGHVYFAPDGHHMGVTRNECITLLDAPPRYGMRPSVATLFEHMRAVYGSSCTAILLSGMGRDGAAEMKELHDGGADTVAQDRISCVVYGMPGRAIEIDAVCHVLTPGGIADHLDQRSGLSQRGGDQCQKR